ncbi:MAG: TolC family protein [Bacteroidales bacterium]|nr:TolC family protein [Bacteroidales bacterium]
MKFNIILLLLLYLQNLSAQEVWDLKKCLETAKESNIELALLKQEIDRAQINQTASKHLIYPNLDADIRTGNNYGFLIDPTTNILDFGNTYMNSFQLNSDFNLFRGFYNKYHKNLCRSQVNTANLKFEKRFNEIALEITFYYYQVLMADESAELIRKRIERLQQRKTFIQGSINSGILHQRNIYSIESLIAQDEALLIMTENFSQQQKTQLMFLLGLSNTQEFVIINSEDTLQTQLSLYDYNVTLEKAINSFPDIKIGNSEIEGSKFAFQQAQSLKYPVLLIEGQIGTKTSTNNLTNNFGTQIHNNFNQYIGLKLNIPLYQNYTIRQGMDIARIDMEIAKINSKNLLLELENKIFTAVTDYNSAYRLFFALQKEYDALKQEYDYASRLFEIGNMGIFEFTDVAERFITSEKELLTAKYNLIIKKKIIDFYTGVLPE